MSYFAAALARTVDGWTAHEVQLDEPTDIDEVADLLRDMAGDNGPALLFVEQDDEYVAIVRVDPDAEDPRTFISDGRAALRYPIVGMLADAVTAPAGEPAPDADEEPEEDERASSSGYDVEPLGDPTLLSDLGTTGPDLLALCAHEGTLPSDLITEVCERAGCLEELEALRVP